MNQIDENYDSLNETIENLKKSSNDTDSQVALANAYYQRGIVYSQEMQYEKALDDYDKSIEIYEKLSESNEGNANELAVTYCERALIYSSIYSMFEAALEDFNKSIEIFEELLNEDKPINPFSYPYAYSGRGMVYEALGEYEKAFEDESRGIEIYEILARDFDYDTRERLFEAYTAIIALLNYMGRYEEAITVGKKSIEIGKNLQTSSESFDEVQLGAAYNTLGDTYSFSKDYVTGNKFYDLGIEIYERVYKESGHLWDLSSLPTAYMNRAANYYEIGDIVKALSDGNRCIELYQIGLNNGEKWGELERAKAYNGRGSCFLKSGDISAGINDKKESLRILKKYMVEVPELANDLHDTFRGYFEEVEYFIKYQKDEAQLQDFYLEFKE